MFNSNLISARTLTADKVIKQSGEYFGKIEKIILDTKQSNIAYAILSLSKLQETSDEFVIIPWNKLRFDEQKDQLIYFDFSKNRLINTNLNKRKIFNDLTRSSKQKFTMLFSIN